MSESNNAEVSVPGNKKNRGPRKKRSWIKQIKKKLSAIVRRMPFGHTIRGKLTAVLIVCMGLSLVMILLACNLLLARFYSSHMKKMLAQTYNQVNSLTGDSEDIYNILSKKFHTTENINMVIGRFNYAGTSVKVDFSTSSAGYVGRRNMEKLFRLAWSSGADGEVWKYNSGKKRKGSYLILKNHDVDLNTDYYNLVGTLDNQHIIVIQTPLENIETIADICNRFITVVAVIATVIGIIIMMIVSDTFSKPIRNMAHVAHRMAELDFDSRVTKFTYDEIGDLGHSMNHMSENLETAIGELKTANNELRKDLNQKTKMEEMRTDFLSQVSHELKTPIALIQGYAEGLKDNIMDDEESKDFYCDVIIDEAGKMNKMVRNLLTLNEIEFGQNNVHFERFDLCELIRNVVMHTEKLNENVNASIHLDLPEEPVSAWADEFMIEEVVTNYFTNALHYVSKGGNIRVYLEKRGDDTRVHVYNDGKQIPEEDIDKLWIKFYKVDKARSRSYGGNGIGLSIVSAIMKVHNKAYGVTNCDHGVDFYFDVDTGR